MRVPNGPLTSKSGNAMAPEKPNHHGHRPGFIMSPLSASGKKTINTTPLTPKIAGSNPANVGTPLLRRATRQETTPSGPQRDERTTPIGSFLSENITPRSGSRKSRLDSTNLTPTGTPTTLQPTESPHVFPGNLVYGEGLGLSLLDDPSPKPTVSFNSTTSDLGSIQDKPQQQAQQPGKFFYASDTKPNNFQPLRQRPGAPKQNSFLYANGDAISSPTNQPGPIPALPIAEDKTRAKFVHANGTPETLNLPSHPFTRTGSTVSTTSFTASPRLAFQSLPSKSQTSKSRPSSPTKPVENGTNYAPKSISTFPTLVSPLIPTPYASPPLHQNATYTAGDEASSPNSLQRRSKSPSIGRLDEPCSAAESDDGCNTPLRNIVDRKSASSAGESSDPVVADDSSSLSGLRSPVKAGSSLEQLNELAANARRERKVLDLEITNSSLSAINRTLEREMRKQTAELRRYRRLSRSGRLSIATTVSRSSVGSIFSLNGISEEQLSDMSEEEYDEDDDDASELDSVDDGTLSPTALAESDARHRKRDEQRLQLDLAKHQQLLIDSQKMNQSIKRCMGLTEELILEANKALFYKVQVSDVELGGRVLVTDDNDDDDNEVIV